MSLRDTLLAAQQQSNIDIPTTASHDSQIDPQISTASYSPPVSVTMEPQDPEVRKGRRELSTSKRAAQNRAAQRAFRQRKEQYIGTLKSQVHNYEQMSTNYKNLERENLNLREYIVTLQSSLLENGLEFPQAPIELRKPSVQISSSTATPTTITSSALPPHNNLDDDSDDDIDISVQLQEAAVAAARHVVNTGRNNSGVKD